MKKIALFSLLLITAIFLVSCGKEIKISFQTNGGSQVEAIKIDPKQIFDEPNTNKEGYTFKGWFEDEELTIPFFFEKGFKENKTLYAKWEINKYLLTVVYNNGKENDEISLDYNENINLLTPQKEGYVF